MLEVKHTVLRNRPQNYFSKYMTLSFSIVFMSLLSLSVELPCRTMELMKVSPLSAVVLRC